MTLSLGFSPCPNDCFMFDAIVHRRIDTEGLEFRVVMADVEALNKAAFAGEADVTKLSYHAYAHCASSYVLLDAGSALGRNCGPLLISKRAISPEEVDTGRLRIAIPGKYTTANFLLGLAFPGAQDRTELLFSAIEPALLNDEFDAGLLANNGGPVATIAIKFHGTAHDSGDAALLPDDTEDLDGDNDHGEDLQFDARGVTRVLEKVADLFEKHAGRIPTAELNRFLGELREMREPPSRRGRRLNLLYGAQVQSRPPRFRFTVNDPSLVTRDYGYWVENQLRERFGLEGVPVTIDFRPR